MADGPENSFGKRGGAPRGPGFHSVPQQQPAPPKPSARSGWWKWVVGGVAALFLLSLIPTGGGSGLLGGGLLGGLIGGLLAGKMMQSLMGRTATPTTVRPGAPAAPAAANSTTQRGGFGSTGRSTSSSFGG